MHLEELEQEIVDAWQEDTETHLKQHEHQHSKHVHGPLPPEQQTAAQRSETAAAEESRLQVTAA